MERGTRSSSIVDPTALTFPTNQPNKALRSEPHIFRSKNLSLLGNGITCFHVAVDSHKNVKNKCENKNNNNNKRSKMNFVYNPPHVVHFLNGKKKV